MFVANVVTRRRPISLRFVTVHSRACRWARLPVRQYSVSPAGVLRLHSRIRRGDGGAVKICKVCRPDRTAAREGDAT